MSTIKTSIGVIFALVVMLILFPLFLWMAGVSVFPFGGGGSSGSGKSGILLRSTDEGVHWDGVVFEQGKGISAPGQALHVAFDTLDPDIMYLGAKANGLWRSTDRGANWKKMNDSSGLLQPGADVYRIAMSTSSPDTLYIAVFQNKKGRVLRSDNRGGSFREVYFVAPDNIPVYDIYVSPTDVNRVALATGQGGVLISHNGGQTWKVAHWFSESMVRVAGNPGFFAEMYAVDSSRRLKKTFDEGENWTELDESNSGSGSIGGGYPGAPGGFSAIPPPIQGFPQEPFYFGGSGGVGSLRIGGSASAGLPVAIETFAIDPRNFERIFIGAVEGLYRSLDGGFIWNRIETLVYPSAITVTAVAVHPQKRGTIFVGIGSELYRTDDDGKTWNVRMLPTSQRIRGIALHPLYPDFMFTFVGK
ncbi:MAG: hypothetical protein HY617_01780 [Candidatus Sungbacteria bacterium]|nr:hypothetical protein [Candidatus Sungbacteria bacterium]